jgi:hypothetical protein
MLKGALPCAGRYGGVATDYAYLWSYCLGYRKVINNDSPDRSANQQDGAVSFCRNFIIRECRSEWIKGARNMSLAARNGN